MHEGDDEAPPPTDDSEHLVLALVEEDSSFLPLVEAIASVHLETTASASDSETPTQPASNVSAIPAHPNNPTSIVSLQQSENVNAQGVASLVVEQATDISASTHLLAPESPAQDIQSAEISELQQNLLQATDQTTEPLQGNITEATNSVAPSQPTAEQPSELVTTVTETAPLVEEDIATVQTEIALVDLVTDEAKIGTLNQKELIAQCVLRKVAKGGNKSVLKDRLIKHIQNNPRFVIPTSSISFDANGFRISPSQQPRSQTVPVAAVSIPSANITPAWVEVSAALGDSMRLTRPTFQGSKEGFPSAELKELTPSNHPIDYFDMFLTPDFRRVTLLQNSNANMWKNKSARDIYPLAPAFTSDEMDKFIGVHIRNGLSPVPDIRLHWTNPAKSFVYGDDRMNVIFPRGVDRFKELKGFFHISDPYAKASDKEPFLKVQDIVDHVMHNSRRNWVLGENVSLDEIDIGFQGRSSLKDKIKYKGEGDGFLMDAIAEGGYFFVGHFRHSPCPVVEKEASPLHNRCLYLIDLINEVCPQEWNVVWMDNLFTSAKFLTWLAQRKKFGAGVCRTSGRGLPGCVVQDVVTKKADLAQAVGTVKIARSSDKKVVAVSIYDSKPVHFMTSFHTSVTEIQKQRKIYDVNQGKMVDLPFTRLNVINDYNFNMNGVDLCDQLRNQYRCDGPWMRQRKWWFPIFLWSVEVALSNAYICYRAKCQVAKVKAVPHRVFLERVSERLCGYQPPQLPLASVRRESISSSNASARATRIDEKFVKQNTLRFTGKHPMVLEENVPNTKCGWCKYKNKVGEDIIGKKRKPSGNPNTPSVQTGQICRANLGCQTCYVWFCGPACWNEFHGL
ncbi:hypothetical protein CYMTET_31882 [Cymbomonas tetramitiformis]|uniref:PiggyBac transposable element-derived protein domain-containing protein n=1 Tax=Cymbomonas tetramitiformis TaxID=36881 RepID=A0AAE0KSF1_9CHLO|nr:hypothetical protein CYMTET_31882 [Cymbomonas tetramitiformis]